MSGNTENEVLLVGYPKTGKTTFLAALWHVVESQEVPGSLLLDRFFEGSRDQIIARHQEWLGFEPVPRTYDEDQVEPVVLSLCTRDGMRSTKLSIPDLSGETFRHHFDDRRWTSDFRDLANRASGIVFFVNPDRVKDPSTIEDAASAIDEWREESESCDAATNPEDELKDKNSSETDAEDADDVSCDEPRGGVLPKLQEFNPKHCCTQVKYVELLQFIAENRLDTKLRIALVVSALDVLDTTKYKNDPSLFVKEKLALLDQYLRSSPERFDYRVYGISAQGAKYDDAGKKKLESKRMPSERIRVVASGRSDNDITRPIRWLALGD